MGVGSLHYPALRLPDPPPPLSLPPPPPLQTLPVAGFALLPGHPPLAAAGAPLPRFPPPFSSSTVGALSAHARGLTSAAPATPRDAASPFPPPSPTAPSPSPAANLNAGGGGGGFDDPAAPHSSTPEVCAPRGGGGGGTASEPAGLLSAHLPLPPLSYFKAEPGGVWESIAMKCVSANFARKLEDSLPPPLSPTFVSVFVPLAGSPSSSGALLYEGPAGAAEMSTPRR